MKEMQLMSELSVIESFGIPTEHWNDIKQRLRVDEQWNEFLSMNGGVALCLSCQV